MLEFDEMAPPSIFVSYSHADNKQKERVLTHLTVLEDAAAFDIWTDTQIGAGESWEPAIEKALTSATLAILLVSADFLSSSFIRHKEVPALLQRREKEGMRLYPILAKPCAWQAVPWLSAIQLRPMGAKPVWRSGGRYADDELARIALEVIAIIQLALEAQKSASNEAGGQEAEQQRREKEKAIADVIAASPPVEALYEPLTSDLEGALELGRDEINLDVDPVADDLAGAQKIYGEITANALKFKAQRARVMQNLWVKVAAIAPSADISRFKGPGGAFDMDKYIV